MKILTRSSSGSSKKCSPAIVGCVGDCEAQRCERVCHGAETG